MQVHILIEWTGTSSEVDGAIIHGVFTSYETAEHLRSALTTTRTLKDRFEIQEFEVNHFD